MIDGTSVNDNNLKMLTYPNIYWDLSHRYIYTLCWDFSLQHIKSANTFSLVLPLKKKHRKLIYLVLYFNECEGTVLFCWENGLNFILGQHLQSIHIHKGNVRWAEAHGLKSTTHKQPKLPFYPLVTRPFNQVSATDRQFSSAGASCCQAGKDGLFMFKPAGQHHFILTTASFHRTSWYLVQQHNGECDFAFI